MSDDRSAYYIAGDRRMTEGIMSDAFDLEVISATVHEALRGYVWAAVGDRMPSWPRAPQWMKHATEKSVCFVLDNPDAPPGEQHRSWMDTKLKDGWTLGEVKDARRKTHPLLVPYDQLPEFEKQKDRLVIAVVLSFTEMGRAREGIE